MLSRPASRHPINVISLRAANFTGFTGVGPSGTLPHRTHGSWTSGYSSAQDTRELDLWVLFRTGHTGVGPLGTLPHKAHGSWTSGYSSVQDTEGWTSGYSSAQDTLFFPPKQSPRRTNFLPPGQRPCRFPSFFSPLPEQSPCRNVFVFFSSRRGKAPVEMYLLSFLPPGAKPLTK